MAATKRYRQLPLPLTPLSRHVNAVCISFKIARRPINGILYGNEVNWTFVSYSPAFLRYISSGRLDKYALWNNCVPPMLSQIYDAIYEAALKAGYSLYELED